MPAFNAANWAAVIAPDFSAVRPYWTPTLSSVVGTNPVRRLRPNWLTNCSVAAHLTPSGLVVGFLTASAGMAALQLWVAVARLANVASHDRHVSYDRNPATAVRAAVENDAPAPAKYEFSSRQSVTGSRVVNGSGKDTPGMIPSTMPRYISAIWSCWIAPPDPPQPI